MDILTDNIQTCNRIRREASRTALQALQQSFGSSEKSYAQNLLSGLQKDETLHTTGWYAPPPNGIMALFGQPTAYRRLQFDTLRKEEFWPGEQNVLERETVAMFYCSPVDRRTGIIGDFGMTVYSGSNVAIQRHLQRSLDVVLQTADFAAVGMELRQIHEFSQRLLNEHGLTNERTVTYTDTVGTNIGHTIPWTYEAPTVAEQAVIARQDITELKNLISAKRVNLNREETFRVPPTIAFTVELRIEDKHNSKLPNAFFHTIVCFVDGKKTMDMDYLHFKF